ncbi:melanophilin isoform X2 [Betta splendens]|uniref:Melanophilin isoform X2 n=1 Tax=Betta splendens TaxID=158456 RepID=A0A6P7LGY4_BETSP|nr:melanophilin isoform X2 [Betta splendens]
MPGTATGKKLDLSKLTDEEAKHVWAVVQRDFDLRKKEEDRLEELKTKIEKEDTKRELLGNQTSLTESYCIRCLQPFKFLVNIKCQCLDCQLHVCKSCSQYNKKEQGWVCDPCRMARVLKIGTLEWYHANVRARFKRFGSAKVMRSLFKRLNGEHRSSHSDLRENEFGEHSLEAADCHHYKEIKKAKRRLTVDPFDFALDCDYSTGSRRLNQAQDPGDVVDVGVRESSLVEAHLAAVFRQIWKEEHREASRQDEFVFSDNPTLPSRSVSQLSYSSCGSGSAPGPWGSSSFVARADESEEDEHRSNPLHQSHRVTGSPTSQGSLNSANPTSQITDLDRRMSAIETFLNHMEQKVSSTYNQTPPTSNSSSPLPRWEDVDLEEQQLRQKLHQMTDNISDKSLTSDDEDGSNKPQCPQEVPAWRSQLGSSKPSRLPTRPASRGSTRISRPEEQQHREPKEADDSAESVEGKGRPLEEGFKGPAALLVELEDKVAQTAADVQNAQSEVSYIENKIAALNAAGMPVDKKKRSAIPVQARRMSHNFPTKASNEPGLMRRRIV